MKIGDVVYPIIGPWRNKPVIIFKIEFGRGARNGWYWVKLPNGEDGMFAGEELRQ